VTISSLDISQDNYSVQDMSTEIIEELREKIKADVKERTDVNNKHSQFNQE
jgi:hypothetical protein